MNQASTTDIQQYGKQSTLEASESAFEYLLGEILVMKPLLHDSYNTQTDIDFAVYQRLDEMGYNVGYRYTLGYSPNFVINNRFSIDLSKNSPPSIVFSAQTRSISSSSFAKNSGNFYIERKYEGTFYLLHLLIFFSG